MADDFAQRLEASRDRISKLLTGQTASLGEIGKASLRSAATLHPGAAQMGLQPMTFGEALNAARADRLATEKALHDVLTSQTAAKREERRLDLQERRLKFDVEKFEREATRAAEQKGREAFKFGWDIMKDVAGDLEPQSALEAYRTYVELAEARNISESSPDYDAQLGLVWEALSQHGLQAKLATTKAPTTRNFLEGDWHVTRRWNPDTGEWDEVTRAPRWQTRTGGSAGLTPTQRARNEQTRHARQLIARTYPDLNADRLAELTTPTTATGRDNPYYDQNLAQLLSWARTPLIGGDPELETLIARWYGRTPEITAGAPPEPPALPGPTVEQPGLVERTLSALGIGGGVEAPAAPQLVPGIEPITPLPAPQTIPRTFRDPETGVDLDVIGVDRAGRWMVRDPRTGRMGYVER